MRSSWPARLLPVVQALTEGGWLAVVYSAVQVATGDEPRIGSLELALLAGMGMAWARRARWRHPATEAAGLPLLALLGGAIGWFLDPAVRGALVDGRLGAAAAMHLPGWLAAIAVLRGGSHGLPEDDEAVQDRLLRFAVPGLAIPWLVGSLVAPTHLRAAFTAAAFVGTMIFAASAFAALGLARLEATRETTGGDWRQSGSWLALVAIISLATVALGIPAALLLGVPLAALAALAFGPIRLLFLLAILLSTPVILVIATLTEMIRPLLPQGITLPNIGFPNLSVEAVRSTSSVPTIIVIGFVVALAAFELAVLGLIVYLRWQERRRMAMIVTEGFEERSIVIPEEAEAPPEAAAAPRRRRRSPADPVDAYLAALDALAFDGRWARRATETPAAHAARVEREGFRSAAFLRLAIGYELSRYARRILPQREVMRARGRLDRVRRALRT